ncbi:unnamed protein product [Rhizoctonia solani]|uniref:Uncharacterized protein n=1 Tax=Rhizoctonia solani TaxID=456999 RepID=A0A8H2X6S3_9AGAM|nr:unnamed protein product [Rhizoctonia solani]
MLNARIKDQERSLRIATVDKLKKIPEIKSQIDFYIHDGSGPHQLLSLNISKKSTSEEILFKLGRNPTANIKLHESAHFYTGPDITWVNKNTVMHIKLGSDPSTYRSKKGFSDFKAYFDSVKRGPVHVFVDRNPSIHILLTTKKWSRLFSLARLIDNDKTMVLKSVDGSLYHAQQVVGQLILSSTGVGVFQLDRATNLKTRTQAGLTASDCIGILREARGFIVAEGRRLNKHGGWLIEVQPSSSEPFDGSTKPKIEYRKGISRNLLLDFSPSTGNVAGNSAQAVSHGASTGADATTRVKEMVKKFEQEKKDTEKREKERGEKKGFFGRVFGK